MKANRNTYSNGQVITKQNDGILTYFFENGEIKAQGGYKNGVMDGRWIFNKKEGYLWQIGNFRNGKRHGSWIRYNADGSVQKQLSFKDDKEVR